MAEWAVAIVVTITCFFNVLCYVAITSRWSKLLVISNRREHIVNSQKDARPQTWFAWDLVDVKHLYAAPAIGTGWLCCFRVLQVALFLFVIVYGNVAYTPPGAAFFLYFTNWTFLVFGLTGICGSILTLQVWRAQSRPAIPCIDAAQPDEGVAPGWTLVNKSYHMLLTTACSASIMLTIFYWIADYAPGSGVKFDDPFKHGVSAMLLLLDVAVSRVPLVSYHIQVSIAYGSLYLVFLWLYLISTKHWVYRALNWSQPLAPVCFTALPLLLLLGYCIMFLVTALREGLLRRSPAGMAGCCCCFCGCASSSSSNDEDILHPEQHITAGKISTGTIAAAAAPVQTSAKVQSQQELVVQTAPTKTSSGNSSGKNHGPPSPTVAILMR